MARPSDLGPRTSGFKEVKRRTGKQVHSYSSREYFAKELGRSRWLVGQSDSCGRFFSVSRRDPVHPPVLQVETPNFGRPHCVTSSHAAMKSIIQIQSGMLFIERIVARWVNVSVDNHRC